MTGYIYNDLKPDNICVGDFEISENEKLEDNLSKIKIIDFGLATPYLKTIINKDGVEEIIHIKKERKHFQGNFAFSSKNAFREITLSRRDDLISLAYLLVYFSTGKFPFVKHDLPLVEQIGRIKRKKNKFTPRHFCVLYECFFLIDFAEAVYDLKFDEKPDYTYLRFLF